MMRRRKSRRPVCSYRMGPSPCGTHSTTRCASSDCISLHVSGHSVSPAHLSSLFKHDRQDPMPWLLVAALLNVNLAMSRHEVASVVARELVSLSWLMSTHRNGVAAKGVFAERERSGTKRKNVAAMATPCWLFAASRMPCHDEISSRVRTKAALAAIEAHDYWSVCE